MPFSTPEESGNCCQSLNLSIDLWGALVPPRMHMEVKGQLPGIYSLPPPPGPQEQVKSSGLAAGALTSRALSPVSRRLCLLFNFITSGLTCSPVRWLALAFLLCVGWGLAVWFSFQTVHSI